MLLVTGPLALAALDRAVSQLLQQQVGLTRRESDLVQHRHRKTTGTLLGMDELEATLDLLPPSLLPGHVAELLRTTGLPALRRTLAATAGEATWCSYKKTLCDCSAHAADNSDDEVQKSLPALVAIDCEFKPLRCAAVDAHGTIIIDCLVTPDVPPAGTSIAPLPSILRCDRPRLRRSTAGELRERLRALLANGTIIVAHTPQSDLRALGFPMADWQEMLVRAVRPPAPTNPCRMPCPPATLVEVRRHPEIIPVVMWSRPTDMKATRCQAAYVHIIVPPVTWPCESCSFGSDPRLPSTWQHHLHCTCV